MYNGFLCKKHETVNWEIPLTWWSRPYEYAWIMKQIKKCDIVIDAGCGIEHPLKWKMAEKCKYVIAVDSDIAITFSAIELMRNTMSCAKCDNIEYACDNISRLHVPKNKVDKVVCCSVLEHLTKEEIIETLKSFYNCIKDDGEILLTCDYPTVSPIWILSIASGMGLELKYDFVPSDDDEQIRNGILNVFAVTLQKMK